MKLILASNNEKKMRELRAILSDMNFEVISQREAGCDFEVDETGAVFSENAFLKAEAVYKATGELTVGDDSGLMVEALNGEPGVYSARYSPKGHDATDTERCEYLLYKMRDKDNRRAEFVTSICCILPDGTVIRTEGHCRGRILREMQGDGGFGYDPVFMPDGYDSSMAVLGTEVKNKISHRADALRQLREKLREYYAIDQ